MSATGGGGAESFALPPSGAASAVHAAVAAASGTLEHIAQHGGAVDCEVVNEQSDLLLDNVQAAKRALQDEIQTSSKSVRRPCERTVYEARDRLQIVALRAAVTQSHLRRMLDAMPEPAGSQGEI